MRVRCSVCSKPFDAQRSSAKFCGGTCRQRAARGSPVPKIVPEETAENREKPVIHPLIAATRRELEDAGKIDTVIGQQALRLAEKLTSPFDSGSAAAAVSKELGRVMAEALADVAKRSDSLDELAARRMQRASGA
jgi:hypothetical protein